jgi:catechol 2,3-dioxygenase-like lactoylglutathione lyase family enzyme
MSADEPAIDTEHRPISTEGLLMTDFLAVRDVGRARAFYAEVLGGRVVMEENPCIVGLANCWVIMNPGGGPTPDKPDVRRVPYEASSRVSSFMNLRVADIEASYREWLVRGAHFLTAPLDQRAGIRCSTRDPDGYLIEVGQQTDLVEGGLAEQAPAGRETGRADGR